MKQRPLILVTNDDGMTAPGLRALVESVKGIGEIIVVAPDTPQSGKGHAITINEPLRMHQVNVFDNVMAYECSGTPVDCVKLAKNVLLKNRTPDICLSGINHGSNASINIIYSGTLSAAMEASLEGIDSIGFSLLDYSFSADFGPCQPFVKDIVEHVLANKLTDTKLLNVNIPVGMIKGIKICRQAEARWVEEFQQGEDPRGEKYYWLTGRFENLDGGQDADVVALEQGYISVVPSMHDLTHYSAIDSLQSLAQISLKSVPEV
ncbi:MAG: 5'/3'-nucleotidase SurE [Saprospiraceae bacterium]|nr:5'/3'-nucleotidase SurE [Saprospiraceae bacterium]